MKTRRIIIAAMAAVLALTSTAGYSFNNGCGIQNIAAADESITGATVSFDGRNYTYLEEYGREYVVCDGMRFKTHGQEASLEYSEDASGDLIIPAEVPLVSGVKNATAGAGEYSGLTAKVTVISEDALRGNKNVTSVTIPDGVEKIGDTAFEYCKSLAAIIAPDKYISIGWLSFDGTEWYRKQCESGKEIVFCGNLLSVPDVEEYTVPDGVKTVYYTGDGLTKLKKLIIPEGTEYILDSFNSCESLKEVVLPVSIKEVVYSFDGCRNLDGLRVDATAEEWNETGRYIYPDICMFDNTGDMFFVPKQPDTGIIHEPYSQIRGKVKNELAVGESIEFSVFGRGFTPELYVLYGDTWLRDKNAMKLEVISREREMGDTLNTTIRYRLTAMETGTFSFMPYMTSPWTAYADQLIITVTENVTETPTEEQLPEYTFTQEDGVDYIIGHGMKFRKAGDDVILISGSDAEGGVIIPDKVPLSAADTTGSDVQYGKVTRICDEAFRDNTKITAVTIPDTVEKIGKKAFNSCGHLEDVRTSAEYIELGQQAFAGTSWYSCSSYSSETEIFAGNLLAIPYDVEEYTVPEGVKAIYCTGYLHGHLKKLTIPEGVEYITDSFISCDVLREVILPQSLKELSNSFRLCKDLSGLTFAGTAEEWNAAARYIDTDISLLDKDGKVFYEPTESPTEVSDPHSEMRGEMKTKLKAGESTDMTVYGSGYQISVSRKNGDDWVNDTSSILIDETERIKPTSSDYNYTATYRITALDPGEYMINVWHAGHYWCNWDVTLTVSAEESATSGETPAVTTELPSGSGDANCDGKLTVADAVAVLQFIANKEKYPLSDEGQENADVDGVKGITGGDAIVIQKMDAGLF